VFHPDSYGYWPGRSALDAVGECRKRCWKFDLVNDLGLRALFGSIDHRLLLKAVSKPTDSRWVLLCVKPCLEAPLQRADGTLVAREGVGGHHSEPRRSRLAGVRWGYRTPCLKLSVTPLEEVAGRPAPHCHAKDQRYTRFLLPTFSRSLHAPMLRRPVRAARHSPKH